MARNINLNSTDWCDIVFEGKNKEYGAYNMRQTSSGRHWMALGSVALFTLLVAFIPQFISAITPEKTFSQGYDGEVVVGDFDLEKPEEEIFVEPAATPPPPPLVASLQFTPPAIVPDSEVLPENEMLAQEALREGNGIISTVTFESDNTVGEDPGIHLRERTEITGTGGGVEAPPVDFVEVMPQFPGGPKEMMKFLSSNLRYPAIAAENDIQGRVVLKFTVKKDGSIADVHVLKTLDSSCDKEAIRVVQSMPKWIPGRQNGNTVAVYFNLPVLFQLQR